MYLNSLTRACVPWIFHEIYLEIILDSRTRAGDCYPQLAPSYFFSLYYSTSLLRHPHPHSTAPQPHATTFLVFALTPRHILSRIFAGLPPPIFLLFFHVLFLKYLTLYPRKKTRVPGILYNTISFRFFKIRFSFLLNILLYIHTYIYIIQTLIYNTSSTIYLQLIVLICSFYPTHSSHFIVHNLQLIFSLSLPVSPYLSLSLPLSIYINIHTYVPTYRQLHI